MCQRLLVFIYHFAHILLRTECDVEFAAGFTEHDRMTHVHGHGDRAARMCARRAYGQYYSLVTADMIG